MIANIVVGRNKGRRDVGNITGEMTFVDPRAVMTIFREIETILAAASATTSKAAAENNAKPTFDMITWLNLARPFAVR